MKKALHLLPLVSVDTGYSGWLPDPQGEGRKILQPEPISDYQASTLIFGISITHFYMPQDHLLAEMDLVDRSAGE